MDCPHPEFHLLSLICFANMNLQSTSSSILLSLHIVVSAMLETALFVHVILYLLLALPNSNDPDAKRVRMFFTQLK